MKIAILGDIHLKSKESCGKMGETHHCLLEDKLKNISYFVKSCFDLNVDEVILLGDIFHNMNPPQWLRDLFWEKISPLIGEKPIYFILGNHDQNRNAINLRKEIEVFGRTSKVFYVVDTYEHHKISMCMAGYGVKSNKLIPAEILITHSGIDKGIVGFYDRPLNDYDYHQEELDAYKLVIAGHFHKPQEYKLGDTAIIYPGSIAPIDFAERDEEKRFVVLDLDDWSVDPYLFPIRREFIALNVEQDKTDIFDVINSIPKNKYEDAIVKVSYKGNSIWYDSINHLGVQEYLYQSLRINDFVPELKITNIEKVEVNISNEDTDMEIIEKFAEQKEIDATTLEVGKQLFNQAKESVND